MTDPSDRPGTAAPSVWGDATTQFFHALTPERVLASVESAAGVTCTGRALALNSMENRVYELELELDRDDLPRHDPARSVIAKFYRPGRWGAEQIADEHAFLAELAAAEIPVAAPLALATGSTLGKLSAEGEGSLLFAVFPKVTGRSPDELLADQWLQVGRLLARMHQVGAAHPAHHRLTLSPKTYGADNLHHLLEQNLVPRDCREVLTRQVTAICDQTTPWFAAVPNQRIHGDCHLGNLLSGRHGLFFVDFDDMVMGPPVQDFWLLVGGRDDEAKARLAGLIEGYEQFRTFDHRSRRLIEALRALRLIHFAAWIGRRWQDPAFPRAFPHFGTTAYWRDLVQDLDEQIDLMGR